MGFFHKINQWALTRYPQIWNLRLIPVLAIILLCHLFHFVVGYFSYNKQDFGNNTRVIDEMFFSSSFFSFSFLLSGVIFVFWLNRMFRNNAFKSYYPLSHRQLAGQFLAVFLIAALNISYYSSYTWGYLQNAKHHNVSTNIEEDVKLYNQMLFLLQDNKDSYFFENRVYPSPFPINKQYNNNDQDNSSANTEESSYYYIGSDDKRYTVAQIEALTGGYKFSYLNYRSDYREITPNNSYYDYDKEDWRNIFEERSKLLNDSVLLLQNMKAFIALCERRNIDHKLDANTWLQWVNHPPFFPFEYSISRNTDLNDALSKNPKSYFVDFDTLYTILYNTNSLYTYHIELWVLCVYLYIALGLSVLVMSYRWTSKKVWSYSVIGSMLLALILGVLTAMIGMNGFSNSGKTITLLYLAIIAGFLLLHFAHPKKLYAGVALNWFIWSLPFVPALIFSLFEIGNDSFMRHNEVNYFFTSIWLYVLAFCLVIVPLYRKWMAAPED